MNFFKTILCIGFLTSIVLADVGNLNRKRTGRLVKVRKGRKVNSQAQLRSNDELQIAEESNIQLVQLQQLPQNQDQVVYYITNYAPALQPNIVRNQPTIAHVPNLVSSVRTTQDSTYFAPQIEVRNQPISSVPDYVAPNVEVRSQENNIAPVIEVKAQENYVVPQVEIRSQEPVVPEVEVRAQESYTAPKIEVRTQEEYLAPKVEIRTQENYVAPVVELRAQQNYASPSKTRNQIVKEVKQKESYFVPKTAASRTVTRSKPISIVRSFMNSPGTPGYERAFGYSFESENGIKQEASGKMKRIGKADVYVMEGSYEYIGNDGLTYVVDWYADETGYHASAPHLPKPVEIPFPEQAAAVEAQLRFAEKQIKSNPAPIASNPSQKVVEVIEARTFAQPITSDYVVGPQNIVYI